MVCATLRGNRHVGGCGTPFNLNLRKSEMIEKRLGHSIRDFTVSITTSFAVKSQIIRE